MPSTVTIEVEANNSKEAMKSASPMFLEIFGTTDWDFTEFHVNENGKVKVTAQSPAPPRTK